MTMMRRSRYSMMRRETFYITIHITLLIRSIHIIYETEFREKDYFNLWGLYKISIFSLIDYLCPSDL